MNYRHVYHAGNFADCFKHALLVGLLDALTRKPAPFFVLETHAGAGRYELDSEAAKRTAEADAGILRLLQTRPAALQSFLDIVDTLGLYPGSPLITQHLMRSDDHLVCCELHPEDAGFLRRLLRDDARVAVLQRSGWEAIGALLPPSQRRGLVFIDPPFENRDEFTVLVDALKRGHRRFGHGIFAAWYPIKQLAAVRGFLAQVEALSIRDVVAVELLLRAPYDPSRLNGCGMLVINPPFQFEEQAAVLAAAVREGLGMGESGGGTNVIRIAGE